MYNVSLQSVRQKRATQVFRKLAPRLKTLGYVHSLLAPDGALLAGDQGPETLPEHSILAAGVQTLSGSENTADQSTWLLAPVGRASIDAWLAVKVSAATDLALAKSTLAFLVADAQQLLHLEAASGQLGERLAGIYEQVRVLFGLTRLLDPAADAREVIHRVFSEIKAGLPFPWMALQFSNHIRLRKEVAGQTMIVGDAPPTTDTAIADLLSHKPTKLTIISPDEPLGQQLKTELVYVPVTYEGQTVALILAGGKTGEDPGISSFETQFLDACAELLSIFHENLARLALQKSLFLGVVHALTSSIDAKHKYTRGHSERVALLATLMGKRLNLDDATLATWKLSGLLHDVGKIGVPEAVLSKPSKLTDEEFEQIKKHPGIGYNILKDIPGLEDALPGVIGHHEQWGGRGYPHGIAGNDIPLLARVLGLCDTFDAMSSSRSYRAALSREVVLEEIKKCAGRQFDPELAEIFITLDFSAYDQMYAAHTGPETLAA